ncbi:MAG: sensor histidine kinase [Leadbetterella sp.]
MSSLLVVIRENITQREHQQQIVLEKVRSELEVLKLQISPHFLFNTLNNIRWLTRNATSKADDAIVKLSSILRYIVYQTNETKTTLEQELTHIQDYIELQKLRLTDSTTVILEINDITPSVFIEPLLFIPFVENAFKYGVSNEIPSRIHIQFYVKDETLYFSCKNQLLRKNTTSLQESGLGIKNVQKRLELLYTNTYSLIFGESDGQFNVKLSLPLK